MDHRPNAAPRRDAKGIDRVDRLILKKLQADGRKSGSELAREVYLTLSPCLSRVRRLEKEGYIEGYAALLSPWQLGLNVLAFVEVCVDRTVPQVFEKFRMTIEPVEEIVECHLVTGAFDYLMKIRVADIHAYRQFVCNQLLTLPGIAHARTYVVSLEEAKSTVSFKF